VDYRFSPMIEGDARAIVGWRYEKPYDVYNARPDELGGTLRTFLDPRNAYYAIRLSGELVGFCCYGPDARVGGGEYGGDDVLDVGLGLRPDLTGRGLGPGFVAAILDVAAKEHHPAGFRLTVASFNQRAIRVYERLGFLVANVFVVHQVDGTTNEWVQMEKTLP